MALLMMLGVSVLGHTLHDNGVISWTSGPVLPGESVIVHGSGLGGPVQVCWVPPMARTTSHGSGAGSNASASVSTQQGQRHGVAKKPAPEVTPDTARAPTPRPSHTTPVESCIPATTTAVARDNTSFVLLVPPSLPAGVHAVIKIATLETLPDSRWITSPQSWWHLGSARGNMTTPGGWLRVFGQGIVFGGPRGCAAGRGWSTSGVATLVLIPWSGGPTVNITSRNATCYAAFFDIPETIDPVMYYNAALFNDITPVATSFDFGDFFPDPVVVIPSDPWPTSQSVTIVVAAGDTAGLMEALLELDEAGGGVVSLQAGVTKIRETLVIADNVTLEGAGMGATTLLISTQNRQVDTPPGGTAPDSAFTGSPGITLGAATAPAARPTGGRGRLRDLRVTVDTAIGEVISVVKGSWGSELTRVHVDATPAAATLARGNAIAVYGDGVTVSDCLLEHGGNCTATHWPHNTAVYGGAATNLLWARNHATCRCQGYVSLESHPLLSAFVVSLPFHSENLNCGDFHSDLDCIPARVPCNGYRRESAERTTLRVFAPFLEDLVVSLQLYCIL
eukprot:m.50432 g.50432  ORF g.50432 m.50432 type:complete len:563 (-) comp16315_c0_seq4:1020-2708(-)